MPTGHVSAEMIVIFGGEGKSYKRINEWIDNKASHAVLADDGTIVANSEARLTGTMMIGGTKGESKRSIYQIMPTGYAPTKTVQCSWHMKSLT